MWRLDSGRIISPTRTGNPTSEPATPVEAACYKQDTGSIPAEEPKGSAA